MLSIGEPLDTIYRFLPSLAKHGTWSPCSFQMAYIYHLYLLCSAQVSYVYICSGFLPGVVWRFFNSFSSSSRCRKLVLKRDFFHIWTRHRFPFAGVGSVYICRSAVSLMGHWYIHGLFIYLVAISMSVGCLKGYHIITSLPVKSCCITGIRSSWR